MTNILIRADASLLIGSGHVMRCRTLARELRRRGAEVSFLCRHQPGDLIGQLEPEFRVLVLPEQPWKIKEQGELDSLQGRNLYSAWLGCSQQKDALDCLKALRQAGLDNAHWLVVDHYGLDASWESQVLAGLAGEPRPKLLVIDDLADRPHQADCLLDQNFFGALTENRYQCLVPQHCRQLLGPHYAILGPEYAQLHPLVPARVELKRVLVFFGGVDAANLTARALEALMDPTTADLAVDVVLGLHSPHRQKVKELVARRPTTTLHDPLPSLSGLITRADLAIGAGGSTTWERACLRLPSLVVSIAQNQLPFTQELHQAGLIEYLGDVDTVTINSIRQSLLSARQRPHPIASGHFLTDGWGASRLATALVGINSPLRLRPASADDEMLLLRWANNAQVRKQSLPLPPIVANDYHQWFSTGLKNPDRCHLIASDSNGCPLGQVRFDRESFSDSYRQQQAQMDVFEDCCVRGQEGAAKLVQLGLEAIEKCWGVNTQDSEQKMLVTGKRKVTYVRKGLVDEINPQVSSRPLGSESMAMAPCCITLLSDSSSWINPYLPTLIEALWQRGHALRWIHHPTDLSPGDICFLLSCSHLLNVEQLALHRHNLVVHESALPQGQGWSPMTWQILQGDNQIPLTLFEATEELDAGVIYLQKTITLNGTELVDEWRDLQAQASINLCLDWSDRYKEMILQASAQVGEPSYYRRRRPRDSKLDLERPLAEQFNLLRVVDNHRYPAYFERAGHGYELHVQAIPPTNS